MKLRSESPLFFKTGADFRAWLTAQHAKSLQQWVGFYRKSSGRRSITWPESVDEALCFGWIDGLRKGIDAKSYKIRFTPRRPISVWSAINMRRMEELIQLGTVHPAGLTAYEKRTANKSAIYAYENRNSAVLTAVAEKRFRSNREAWKWFDAQTAGYRQTAIWWVITAKKPETQEKRFATLIADSQAKTKIKPLRRTFRKQR